MSSGSANFNDVKFLDAQLETLYSCKPLPEESVKQLCDVAKEILVNESNV